jgi:hypothetical protein
MSSLRPKLLDTICGKDIAAFALVLRSNDDDEDDDDEEEDRKESDDEDDEEEDDGYSE